MLCLLPNAVRAQAFELRQENDSLYWLIATGGEKDYATGGNKAEGWRLVHPVYQFQTGDVDGDGSEDAMVGVIKKTRYYPMGRRLFIFKQIDGTNPKGEACKKVRPMWLGSKLGGILEDFRFIAPADGDSLGRIRALESTTDSLYVVSDYKWSGFGMKFERFIIKGVDKETALRYFTNKETALQYFTDKETATKYLNQ
jgi:hypothetical protein